MKGIAQLLKFRSPITTSEAPRPAVGSVDVKHYVCCHHCLDWAPADCPITHDSPCPEPICGQAWAS